MIAFDSRLTALSSPELLAALERVAAQGREVTADLLALLAECDDRKLHEPEGFASLFEFCVKRLRLSESQAYHRIQAARAARRFPVILDRLREGRITLTAVALLRQHLTDANHLEVLAWAEGKRKAEVEEFIRGLAPLPDVRASLRRLTLPRLVGPTATSARDHPAIVAHCDVPAGSSARGGLLGSHSAASADTAAEATSIGGVAAAPLSVPHTSRESVRAAVHALSPARYSLRVTISQETRDKLRRAQDLLQHAVPSADPALVLERALTLLVEHLERRRFGAEAHETGRVAPSPRTVRGAGVEHPTRNTPRSAGRSRYIPATVRRAVWIRDEGRCAFVAPNGVRCDETGRLEFHHLVPFADGGPSTLENLALRCTRHNGTDARRWSGDEAG
jgi:5-methylcytosine-specific restriction endonuclease McrA